MNKYIAAALTSTLVLAGACQDNPVAPSRDSVVAGSQQTLVSLVRGITAQDRTNYGGYLLWGGIMARDAIVPTANESRFVTEFYVTPPDPSDFIGGSQWTGYYQMLRASQILLKDPSFTSLSPADQGAARGFIRTLDALSYIRLIDYRDQNQGIGAGVHVCAARLGAHGSEGWLSDGSVLVAFGLFAARRLYADRKSHPAQSGPERPRRGDARTRPRCSECRQRSCCAYGAEHRAGRCTVADDRGVPQPGAMVSVQSVGAGERGEPGPGFGQPRDG